MAKPARVQMAHGPRRSSVLRPVLAFEDEVEHQSGQGNGGD